jgi:hypothetical protein
MRSARASSTQPRAFERARRSSTRFLAAELASVLGPERLRAEVERRQDQVRSAQRDLSEALTANLVLGQEGSRSPEQLVAEWPTLTIADKRAVVRAYVERVTLAKAEPKRRRWQPISERVQVEWVAAPAPRPG